MLEGQVYTVYLVFLMHDITGHPSANGVVNDSPCVLLALCVYSSTEEGFEANSVQEVHHGPDQEPRVVQKVSPLSIDTLSDMHLSIYILKFAAG
jgi:hypothetical protein